MSQRAEVITWLNHVCPDWEDRTGGFAMVYRAFSADGALLYVGSTMDPVTRFLRHFTHSAWIPEVRRMTAERWPSLGAARAAERAEITAEDPKHNRAGTPRDGRRRAVVPG